MGQAILDRDPGYARGGQYALARVPMLDWRADLFSDNATISELITEDLEFLCEELSLTLDQPTQERHLLPA